MRFIPKTFGVDLVDVLGGRWARGEPTTLGDDFDAADGCIVAGCPREHPFDLVARDFGRAYSRAVELAQCFLLSGRRRRIHSIGHGVAEVAREFPVGLTRVAAGPCRDLSR